MIITASDNEGVSYTIDILEAVEIPWRDKRKSEEPYIIAFDGYHPNLSMANVDQISVKGYDIVVFGNYIAGIANRVPLPYGILRSPSDLLNRMFPQFAGLIIAPQVLKNPNIHTIPEGKIGAGLILVKDLSKLTPNLNISSYTVEYQNELLNILLRLGCRVLIDTSKMDSNLYTTANAHQAVMEYELRSEYKKRRDLIKEIVINLTQISHRLAEKTLL